MNKIKYKIFGITAVIIFTFILVRSSQAAEVGISPNPEFRTLCTDNASKQTMLVPSCFANFSEARCNDPTDIQCIVPYTEAFVCLRKDDSCSNYTDVIRNNQLQMRQSTTDRRTWCSRPDGSNFIDYACDTYSGISFTGCEYATDKICSGTSARDINGKETEVPQTACSFDCAAILNNGTLLDTPVAWTKIEVSNGTYTCKPTSASKGYATYEACITAPGPLPSQQPPPLISIETTIRTPSTTIVSIPGTAACVKRPASRGIQNPEPLPPNTTIEEDDVTLCFSEIQASQSCVARKSGRYGSKKKPCKLRVESIACTNKSHTPYRDGDFLRCGLIKNAAVTPPAPQPLQIQTIIQEVRIPIAPPEEVESCEVLKSRLDEQQESNVAFLSLAEKVIEQTSAQDALLIKDARTALKDAAKNIRKMEKSLKVFSCGTTDEMKRLDASVQLQLNSLRTKLLVLQTERKLINVYKGILDDMKEIDKTCIKKQEQCLREDLSQREAFQIELDELMTASPKTVLASEITDLHSEIKKLKEKLLAAEEKEKKISRDSTKVKKKTKTKKASAKKKKTSKKKPKK
ncbi:hypothetical protein HYW83_00870 [Candidatus Peregrinibacteria bacterium]|nr:hypothetical protein [Candidatus Peregrinibacteria bacterium]